MIPENEYASEVAIEPQKHGLRFMARYGGAKTLICQIKGQRVIEIYLRRGFVEIDKDEYKRLAQAAREARGE